MPSRKDGRIEKGQPIATAISARAWNRAQQAADVVLGVQPEQLAKPIGGTVSRLVIPVRLQIPTGITGIAPGLAVVLSDAFPKTELQDATGPTPYSGGLLVNGCSGSLTTLSAYDPLSTGAIGITVDGASGNPGDTVAVPVAISGVAVARVRRFSTSHRFAVSPVRRISESTVVHHRGILDSHPCACDTSVRVISFGPAATTFTDTTAAQIVWAVVLL